MTIKKLLPLLILPLLIAGCESKSDRRKHLCADFYSSFGEVSKKNKLMEEFGIVVSGKNTWSEERKRINNGCEYYD